MCPNNQEFNCHDTIMTNKHTNHNHHHHHHHHDGKHSHDHNHHHGKRSIRLSNMISCVVCLFMCCCMQAVVSEEIKFGEIKRAYVASEMVRNYTINATTSMNLKLNVQPCNGSIGWKLYAPNGAILKSIDPHMHEEEEEDDGHEDEHHHEDPLDEVHDRDHYFYNSTTSLSNGIYTLSIHGETLSGSTAIDISAYKSNYEDPQPNIKNDKISIHSRTSTSLELEWPSTTSIAADHRIYKIYITESIEPDDAVGTTCAIDHLQLQPIAVLKDEVNSYEFTNLKPETNYNIVLTVTDALTGYTSVYSALTAATSHDEHHSVVWKSWVYSMLAIFATSLVSLSGGLLMLMNREKAEKILPYLLGLALGSLLGTAMFTLLPESNEIYHGTDLKICGIILGGIGFGYIVETLVHLHKHHISMKNYENSHHGHAHVHEHVADSIVLESRQALNIKRCKTDETDDTGGPKEKDNTNSDEDDESIGIDMDVVTTLEGEKLSQSEVSRRQHNAILSLVGDMIHNIVDGALIGATFVENTSVGITVTVAILLHEIPQEMGDFCILLHAGWSNKKALFANFMVSLTSIIGAIISLSIGTAHEDTTNYFIPFAAGMFIYLALGGLLPELTRLPFKEFLKAGIFICLGLTMIGLLLLYEDDGHSHGDTDSSGGHAAH